MEKIKSWWSSDGKWFCILANDGASQATVSLTRAEAKALAEQIALPIPDQDLCDCGGNGLTGKWDNLHTADCASLRL